MEIKNIGINNGLCDITTGWITLNTGCNNRCTWCYRTTDLVMPAKLMPNQKAKRVLDFYGLLGIDSVIYIGGEPTLYKALPNMVRIAKQNGIKECVLVTNGRRLSNPNYVVELSEAGMDIFSITIYSANQDIHDKVTKVKSWCQTSVGIQNAIKLGKKVSLNVVVGPHNYSTIVDSVKTFVDWGVEKVVVSCALPFMGNNSFIGDVSLNPKLFADLATRLIDTPPNVFVLFELPLCLMDRGTIQQLSEAKRLDYGCHIGLGSGIVVDIDGKVLPCNSFANFPLFDLFENDMINMSKEEFYKFWNHDELLVKFRGEANVLRSPACQSCSLWQICNCGCPLLWGHYNPSDYINENLVGISIETIKQWVKIKQ